MTKKTTAEKAVSAVKKPRTVKASSPRVTSVRHKAAVTSESPVSSDPIVSIDAVSIEAALPVNASEAIAKIAYGYWEARGCQGGDTVEDWLRAEAEFASL